MTALFVAGGRTVISKGAHARMQLTKAVNAAESEPAMQLISLTVRGTNYPVQSVPYPIAKLSGSRGKPGFKALGGLFRKRTDG